MEQANQLGQEKVLKLLMKFSIPAIIGMLVNALYNIVDRIFIGKGVGTLALAGLTIGMPIMLVMMAFSMLVGLGATALISIRLGENKREEAENILGNGMVLLILVGVAISIAGNIFLEPLLKAFGASEAVLPYARDYMRIILMGTVFQAIGFGMNHNIRAEGNPKIAMLTMLIGAITNTILDPIFIFVLNWGVKGAAIATVISQAISATWVLSYFLSGKSALKIRKKNLKIKMPIALKIATLGAAPFALQLAASLMNVLMNKSLNFYGGDVAISGVGIINSIMMLILMPVFGINQGSQPIIGYNYGARKFDRVKQALKAAMLAATTIVIIGFFATRLFPAQLIGLFNDEDQALIDFGVYALKIIPIFIPIIGVQIVGANYFQAIGKPKHSMLLSLSRQVLLLIPAILILPKFFGLKGLLLAIPTADIGAFIITGIWVLRELKSLDQKHQDNPSGKLQIE